MKASLVVERLQRVDELRKLDVEWAGLAHESRTTNPFLGPAWTIPWVGELLPKSDDTWVLTVRSHDRLVGIAPFYLHRYRFGIRRLQMIGSGHPWIGPFEAPAVLAAPGYGRPVGRALFAYLAEHRSSWDLVSISFGDSIAWPEPTWLPKPDFTVVPQQATPFVILPLPLGPRTDDDSRRNLKEAVRRARNRLNRRFGAQGWKIDRLTQPSELRSGFNDLVTLHRARSEYTHKGEKHPDVLADDKIREYMHTVVKDLASRGQVTLYRLVAGNEVLAVQLVLHTATASFLSLSGFQNDAWDFSPTNYLQWVAVDDAAVRGDSEMNLSSWPTQAKLRWSREIRAFQEFLLVGPSRTSRAVAQVFVLLTAMTRYRQASGFFMNSRSVGGIIESVVRLLARQGFRVP